MEKILHYEIYDAKDMENVTFHMPCQAFAKFSDLEDLKGGIVYKDEFICGCCGDVFPLKGRMIETLYAYTDWYNVSDSITGNDSANFE